MGSKSGRNAPPPEILSARLPGAAVAAIAAVWGWFCLRGFLTGNAVAGLGSSFFLPLPSARSLSPGFWAQAGVMLLELAFFWAAAWGLGRRCLRALAPKGWERGERILLAMGLGAGLMGLFALGLGLSGALRPRLVEGLLAVLGVHGLVCAARAARGFTGSAGSSARPALPPGTWPAVLMLALLAAYGALIAMAPPTFYDSLVYHLALPDLYLRRGRIVPTPAIVFSGIPFGVEMLYVWLLPLRAGAPLCALLHWSLGLLTGAALAALGKRLGHAAAGLWAAAIFYSNPMVLLAGSRPAVELGWSFYLALTLLALTRGDKDRRRLTLAGALAGLALGVKYQAIFLLPAAAVYLCRREGWREGLRASARVWLVAGLVAAPWGLKNIAFYHNPVYPFFDAGVADPAGLAAAAQARGIGRVFGTWEGFRSFVAHPWIYTMPAGGGGVDNGLSLVYLMALPVLLSCRLSGRAKGLLSCAAALWLPMNLATSVARFSIPALVPLSLAFSLPLASLTGAAALAFQAAAAAVFCLNGLYAYGKPIEQRADMALFWPALAGGSAADEYLSRPHDAYPDPPYAAYLWANRRLPPDAKVLLIGEERSFYLERDREAASLYARQPIAAYANASSSGEDLVRRLAQDGVTHVFFNPQEMFRTGQSIDFTPAGAAAFRSFWNSDLELLRTGGGDDPANGRFSMLCRIAGPARDGAPRAAPLFLGPTGQFELPQGR